jgi:hypothetical protein
MTWGGVERHVVVEEIRGDEGVHPGMHDALYGILIGSVCPRDVEKHMISEGIFAQGIEEEAVPRRIN